MKDWRAYQGRRKQWETFHGGSDHSGGDDEADSRGTGQNGSGSINGVELRQPLAQMQRAAVTSLTIDWLSLVVELGRLEQFPLGALIEWYDSYHIGRTDLGAGSVLFQLRGNVDTPQTVHFVDIYKRVAARLAQPTVLERSIRVIVQHLSTLNRHKWFRFDFRISMVRARTKFGLKQLETAKSEPSVW